MFEIAVIATFALCILVPLVLPSTIAVRRHAFRLAATTASIAAIVMLGLFIVLNQVGGYPNFIWWIFYPLAAGGLTIVLMRVVLLSTRRPS